MSHMEFRKAGSEKFYAPERDLLHAAGPLLKSALGLTLDSFGEDEVTNEEFEVITSAVAAVRRGAMLQGPPEDVAADLFKSLGKAKEEAVALFLASFFRVFVLKYVEALRDAASAPELTSGEIEASLRSLGGLSALPEEVRKEARAAMQAAGYLKRVFAAACGLYEVEGGEG